MIDFIMHSTSPEYLIWIFVSGLFLGDITGRHRGKKEGEEIGMVKGRYDLIQKGYAKPEVDSDGKED